MYANCEFGLDSRWRFHMSGDSMDISVRGLQAWYRDFTVFNVSLMMDGSHFYALDTNTTFRKRHQLCGTGHASLFSPLVPRD
jgi:hypothetical protein